MELRVGGCRSETAHQPSQVNKVFYFQTSESSLDFQTGVWKSESAFLGGAGIGAVGPRRRVLAQQRAGIGENAQVHAGTEVLAYR